jgi:transposase
MANVLSEQKRQQVEALGRLNWSLRQIEEATGVRRETASAYLKAAGIAIRAVRGRRAPPKPASRAITDSGADSKPASQAITDSAAVPPAGLKAQPSACEPHREMIERALSDRRNGVAIYQELVDTHGFAGSYSSVRRFVRRLRGHGRAKTFAVIHTDPGEEAQVDYGTGPLVRHPETGKYRRTRLFVLTLGHSRKCVRWLVWKSSSRMWAELHEKSFRRLGGCPRVLVLDNLKEGVLTPDIYDPELNPLYRDLLTYHGAVALPCRIRNPDRKGKVERGIDHAQETPLKGLKFESMEEAQAHLDHWEVRWADTRIHGTTKRQVAAMFAEEKPYLQPLPVEPFRYYEHGTRTVHLDGHIEVARAYYSVPPGHVGRLVWVQWDARHVRIMSAQDGQLLREHTRQQPGRHRTAREDRPAPTPSRLHEILQRARRAGAHIGKICQLIHEREGDLGTRRILGVIALVKRFGTEGVEDACAAALEIGTPTYRFVRRYVERHPALRLTLKQIDPLIRELSDYRDLIDRITTNPPLEEP